MKELLRFDHWLFQLMNSEWTSPLSDRIFISITDLHKNSYFAIALVVLVIYLFLSSYRLSRGTGFLVLMVATIGLADFSANLLFKKTFERPRPAATEGLYVVQKAPASGFSFVSNHAVNMTCFAVMMAFFFPGYATFFAFIATLVAYSRIYNGVHFPSDVVVGALYGYGLGRISCWGIAKWSWPKALDDKEPKNKWLFRSALKSEKEDS